MSWTIPITTKQQSVVWSVNQSWHMSAWQLLVATLAAVSGTLVGQLYQWHDGTWPDRLHLDTIIAHHIH